MSDAPPKINGLKQVTHLLAVSSCKGGVGKSTVAVNLACALKAQGKRVGLFDADVYGPSLPTMVEPEGFEGLYQDESGISPVRAFDMPMMSFGWVPTQGDGSAAIMRGPMVSSVIGQLLTGTNWGELDVLVIDFPPGTGDIQLTLGQIVNLSAAVIVTTPQKLAYVDVEKGIEMFGKLKVPSLAVVENMSWFRCGSCSEKHFLFGTGAGDRLAAQFALGEIVRFPLEPELASQGDAGLPFVFAHPEHEVSATYAALAERTWEGLEGLADAAAIAPELSYNVGQDMVLTLADGTEHEFTPAWLRRQCRCAHCVDEMSGEAILDPATVSEDIYPTKISPMGNYAIAIEWSEPVGSCQRSIFPVAILLEAAAAT